MAVIIVLNVADSAMTKIAGDQNLSARQAETVLNPGADFWNINFGHLVMIAGLMISVWLSNRQRRKDNARQHVENLERLARIEEQMKFVKHLDRCIDDMRRDVNGLKGQIIEWMGRN